MSRTAFLSIWARSKVLYEHSWLNKLEESVPSNSVTAVSMEEKLMCSVIPKPAEGRPKIGMEKIENLIIKARSIFHPDLTNYHQKLNEYYSSYSIQ